MTDAPAKAVSATKSLPLASEPPPTIGFGLQWRAAGKVAMPASLEQSLHGSKAEASDTNKSQNVLLKYWKSIVTLTTASLVIWLLIIAVSMLRDVMAGTSVQVEPLSVPKSLAESGYTPEVAAQRLRDGMSSYAKRVSNYASVRVGLHTELPKIIVPTVNVALDSFVDASLRFLGLYRKVVVTGEIVDLKNKLWLRLRLDGALVYSSISGAEPNDPDRLWRSGVKRLYDQIDPYIAAASRFATDPDLSKSIAERIVAAQSANNSRIGHLKLAKALSLIGAYYRVAKHDLALAIETTDKAINADPTYAGAYINRANIFRDQNDINNAIEFYNRAISIDKQAWRAYQNIGHCLNDKHEFREAINNFRIAIELHPTAADAYVDLGNALKKLNRQIDANENFQAAILIYKDAIETDPNDAEALFGLGNAYKSIDMIDEAVDSYKATIKLSPKYIAAYSGISASYIAKASKANTKEIASIYNNAIEWAEKAKQIDINHRDIYSNLGYAYMNLGIYDKAIENYNKYIELKPNASFVYTNLGWIYSHIGDDAVAMENYKKAIQIDPYNSTAYTNISIMFRNQNKQAEADAALEKAREAREKN